MCTPGCRMILALAEYAWCISYDSFEAVERRAGSHGSTVEYRFAYKPQHARHGTCAAGYTGFATKQ